MNMESDHKRVYRTYVPLVAVVLIALMSDFSQQSFAQVFPNDPEFPKQYGLHNTGQTVGNPGNQLTGISDEDIDAPEGWQIRRDAGDVIVAVMDFGVLYNHPDLAANIWTNPREVPGNGIDDDQNGYIDDIQGWDFVTGQGSISLNSAGHGTITAGVIGAVGNNGIGVAGVAWNVKIMVLRVNCDMNQWASAIRYAVDNGAKVINHSQCVPFFAGNSVFNDAVSYANDRNVLYVTAASNDPSANHDLMPSYPCSAPQPNAICVTATNARGDGGTGYGATTVDIAAPGNLIFSTVVRSDGTPDYDYASGTSHAGPYVSGVAALIYSQKPGITVQQVKQIILSTVDPLAYYSPSGQHPIVSGGRVNLYRALSSSLGSPQGFPTKVTGPNYSDGQGWGASPAYYETIQLADVNGDGKADVCARGNYGTECMLSTGTGFANWFLGPAWSDANGWATPDKYKTIQFADINGDGKADICGRAATGYECWLSNGTGFPTKVIGPNYSDGQGWGVSPAYYETIQLADVNGDGKADSCARGNYGISCMLSTGNGFANFFYGPAWSDANGWATPDKYKTIRFADINGDGKADICGRASTGYECWLSNGVGFPTKVTGPNYSDGQGWGASPAYYETIQLADVNGDGKADVCARGGYGTECMLSSGSGFANWFLGPVWSDANGWATPDKYKTIQFADINGDGKADICGRAATGYECWLSDGTGFPTPLSGPTWSDVAAWILPQYYLTIKLSDVNGNLRRDVCARASLGYECWLSN